MGRERRVEKKFSDCVPPTTRMSSSCITSWSDEFFFFFFQIFVAIYGLHGFGNLPVLKRKFFDWFIENIMQIIFQWFKASESSFDQDYLQIILIIFCCNSSKNKIFLDFLIFYDELRPMNCFFPIFHKIFHSLILKKKKIRREEIEKNYGRDFSFFLRFFCSPSTSSFVIIATQVCINNKTNEPFFFALSHLYIMPRNSRKKTSHDETKTLIKAHRTRRRSFQAFLLASSRITTKERPNKFLVIIFPFFPVT